MSDWRESRAAASPEVRRWMKSRRLGLKVGLRSASCRFGWLLRESRDLVIGKADLLQIGAGVLAERRHSRCGRNARPGHPEGEIHHLKGASVVLYNRKRTAMGD